MRKLSKNTGLSDFGIKKTAFCQQSGVVVVVYEDEDKNKHKLKNKKKDDDEE